MRRSALVMAVLSATMLAAPPASAATPRKVVDTADNEWSFAREKGYQAWAVDRPAARFVFSLKVKPAGKPAYRVNPFNTSAHLGDIEVNGLHGDVMVYEIGQNKGKGDYDIAFWDLQHKKRIAVRKGINTTASNELYPSISGGTLLFARGPHGLAAGRKIILYSFSAKTSVTVTSVPKTWFVQPGGLSHNFAVYDVCPANGRCSVYRRKLSTGTTTELPNGGRAAYWPVVTRDGVVYYVQGSPLHCGVHTQIRMWTKGNTSRKLFEFPDGIEIGRMYVDSSKSPDTLFFTRIKCGQPNHDGIWKIAI